MPGGEGAVAAQRGVAGGTTLQARAQLAAAGDAEVEGGPDSLGGQRKAVSRGVAAKKTPSPVAGRNLCGIQLP